MACSGVIGFAAPPLKTRWKSGKGESFCCSSSSAAVEEEGTFKTFTYSRASPSVRWPHMVFDATQYRSKHKLRYDEVKDENEEDGEVGSANAEVDEQEGEMFDKRLSRNKVKKMNKLALKRAKDWRNRVRFLTDKILGLKAGEFVADVLDAKMVQMTPTDFCFVVKWVGESSWQRALEVFEWLNLRHWYAPNARMLATVLAVLGKANQEALAVEIFTRAEPTVGNAVQVYNAMMGVYARNGQFSKVQELLRLMGERGCHPDLVSFNTLINARVKSGPMTPNLGIQLLSEVRRSGIRPDVITYNTLISGCSRDLNLEEAMKIFSEMQNKNCQPDLWTYNAMISVYGRCGLSNEAELLFKELGSKGFYPDAVTYNSLLYAFAREGNVTRVKDICQEMVRRGSTKDEMTYNTIICMYVKQGKHEFAFQVYDEMKSSGRNPDAVTYTVLIDSLGKASKMMDAAKLMSEMLDMGIRPTLRTYSALICGYAKAGQRTEAEEIFNSMRRSGIKPDNLAYSVMLDVHLRSKKLEKAILLYEEMIADGLFPDIALYEGLLQSLGEAHYEEKVQKVIEDLKVYHGFSNERIPSILAKSGCHDFAAEALKLNVMQSSSFDREDLISIVASYSLAKRHPEAIELLNFMQEHTSGPHHFISEGLIVLHCKADNIDDALDEYARNTELYNRNCSSVVYKSLIMTCQESGRFAEACQVFSDMKFIGVEPSAEIYKIMAIIYCKMNFPETAHHMVDQAEIKGSPIYDTSVCAGLVEAYGKVRELEKAERFVGMLRNRYGVLDRNIWNSLIGAYAANGCYEKARAAFTTMMRDGPSPTVDSINGLLKALITAGRLDELHGVIQDLQDKGFKISKSSIVLMLEAFSESGNVVEVKKIYQGMKAAGYLPTMHLYRVILSLMARAKQVKDVEAMFEEMKEEGFVPDLFVYNLLLKLYTQVEDYTKTVQVFQSLKESGIKPNENTYRTLIIMYCRDCRPDEATSLLQEMRRLGMKPCLETYKSLTAAYCKKLMVEEAEDLLDCLKSEGHQLDRSFYHLMMKMYRRSGDHSKAEGLLLTMKDSGVEPSVATMYLLMTSHSSSGNPAEAEKVLDNLKSSGTSVGTLEYSSVIDAYLKNGDLEHGIQKLSEMKKGGVDPDHRIWTCFIRAASICDSLDDSTRLLTAIEDAGFDIPLRLLKENSTSLLAEIDVVLKELELLVHDYAAFNLVNALEDMLWAYERRATAALIFQLAMKRGIYHRNIFRVAEKDWGADFRKLSAGAALTAMTLWLDHMQDASLQGIPESPKSVVLITGAAEYNKVSLEKTLKAFLWEMGSPFLPCKTRTGVLVAKAHSLRSWLKDSPFCLDLELKDNPNLPDTNSMQLISGCYIRRGLAPAFHDIDEQLGQVSPRKFARLALLSDDRREKAIRADIDGRKQKLAKMREAGARQHAKRTRRHHHKLRKRGMLLGRK